MDSMGIKDILLYGEDVLRQPAEPVDPSDAQLKELVDRMIQVLQDAKGLGLAANQIGVPKQVIVYDTPEGPQALLNPKIVRREGKEVEIEGCLSIPGLQGEVHRATSITVEGLDLQGNTVRIKAEGLLARVFQHELDHLNGSLFVDHADPDTLQWVTEESSENKEQ